MHGGLIMDNYKLTIGVEPTEKYQRAKQDLLQAFKSYNELTPMEQECLAKEIWGAAQVELAYRILSQYRG